MRALRRRFGRAADPGWSTVFVSDKTSGTLAAVITIFPSGRPTIAGPYGAQIKKVIES